MIKFENSFHKLNTDFYENVIPSKPPKPELISFNTVSYTHLTLPTSDLV